MARFLVLLGLWQTAVSGSFVDRSVLLSKRSSDTCSSSPYTSPVGLQFAISCNSNIPGADFEFPTSLVTDDIYDCMRHCSTHSPGCYGVSYNFQDAHCYLKNSSVVGKTINGNDAVTHSALVSPTSQFNALDATCPFTDASTTKTTDGMPFKISCGKDISGGNYCPPSSNSSCPVHATSLSNCMEQCSSSHPLCTAVSYNPGMENGYANCQFKSNFANAGFVTPSYTIHSAVFQIQNISTTCTDSGKLTAANTNIFGLQCNQNRPGNDLSVYHEVSLQKCVDNCATYDGSKCVGVIFDGNMELGYENCYLKSGAGTPLYNSTAVFALSTGTKDTSSSSSSPSSSSSSSSSTGSKSSSNGGGSKAWIAGPVVAAIVVLALIAGLLIWRRRRASARAGAGHMGHGPIVEGGHQEQHYSSEPKVMNGGSYFPASNYSDTPFAKPPTYAEGPPVELADTQHPSELSAHGSGK